MALSYGGSNQVAVNDGGSGGSKAEYARQQSEARWAAAMEEQRRKEREEDERKQREAAEAAKKAQQEAARQAQAAERIAAQRAADQAAAQQDAANYSWQAPASSKQENTAASSGVNNKDTGGGITYKPTTQNWTDNSASEGPVVDETARRAAKETETATASYAAADTTAETKQPAAVTWTDNSASEGPVVDEEARRIVRNAAAQASRPIVYTGGSTAGTNAGNKSAANTKAELTTEDEDDMPTWINYLARPNQETGFRGQSTARTYANTNQLKAAYEKGDPAVTALVDKALRETSGRSQWDIARDASQLSEAEWEALRLEQNAKRQVQTASNVSLPDVTGTTPSAGNNPNAVYMNTDAYQRAIEVLNRQGIYGEEAERQAMDIAAGIKSAEKWFNPEKGIVYSGAAQPAATGSQTPRQQYIDALMARSKALDEKYGLTGNTPSTTTPTTTTPDTASNSNRPGADAEVASWESSKKGAADTAARRAQAAQRIMAQLAADLEATQKDAANKNWQTYVQQNPDKTSITTETDDNGNTTYSYKGKNTYFDPSYGQGGKGVKLPYKSGGYDEKDLIAAGNNTYGPDRYGHNAYEGYYYWDGKYYPVDQEKAAYYLQHGYSYKGWEEPMREYYQTFGTFYGYRPDWKTAGGVNVWKQNSPTSGYSYSGGSSSGGSSSGSGRSYGRGTTANNGLYWNRNTSWSI